MTDRSTVRVHPPQHQRFRDELADFSADARLGVLSALALAIGAAAAGVAWLLLALIDLITNVFWHHAVALGGAGPADHRLGAWAALIPPLGGLLIGLLARYGSEKIRGHGIPEALEAILIGESRMSLRVALLKPLSSALSIGTGGPFGAEGPIIMTGGAVGSLVAQGFHLSSAERKTLLVCGAAAGMSAIFSAPLAAILLAVELLLFEWKPRSFVPVALAAVAAGALRIPLLGAGPVFPVPAHAVPVPALVGGGFALGLCIGLCAALLTAGLYAVEDLFHRLPIHWMWWPALGGAAVGIAGLADPRVLGVGYAFIHAMLRGELLGPALLGLLVAKAVAWTIALGSGTSGGVLAPLLTIGAALGALLGGAVAPGAAGVCALLGMAAMMAGTMRAPFTAVVFAVELTGRVELLVGVLAACVAAEAVTVLVLRRSILTEKVARRGHHLTHEYMVDPLELARVGEVMDPAPWSAPADLRVGELMGRIAAGDPAATRHQAVPILDGDGALAGIITRGDLLEALRAQPAGDAPVLDAGTRDLVVARPDETVREALVKMLRHGVGRLPVVARDDPRRLVGYLGRAHVLAARERWWRSEHARERGWARPAAGAGPVRPAS